MNCPKCGAENNPTHTFCAACGAPLRPPAPVDAPAARTQSPAGALRSFPGGVIGAVAGVVAVLVVVAFLLGVLGGGPETGDGPGTSFGEGGEPSSPDPGNPRTLETDTVAVVVPEDMAGEAISATSLRLSVPQGPTGTAPLPYQTLTMLITSAVTEPVNMAEEEAIIRQQWASSGGTICLEEELTLPNWPAGARLLGLCSAAELGAVALASAANGTQIFTVVASWAPHEDASGRFVELIAAIDWKLLTSP